MLEFSKIAALRTEIAIQKAQGKTIVLVPTMGNLHAGHLKLVTEALSRGDFVITTIFVNPLQFAADEDLGAYPRTVEEDRQKLTGLGCHCLFAPDADEIYPDGLASQTLVSVAALGANFCGKSRPGHFDGVATVVCKLFNIVQPDMGVFGLKDYQQFLIIRKLVYDLKFPIEIIGVETQRESNGLAMSSRNIYLDAQQRVSAGMIYQCLLQVAASLRAGEQNFRQLEQQALDALREAGLKPDYFAICHADTLAPAQLADNELIILAAAYLGPARLIDNQRLKL